MSEESDSRAAPFSGRIALVTGASRGIGRAIASEFARRGATVIAVARESATLRRIADELGPEGATMACDLARAQEIKRIADFVGLRFGHLDILVANAAIMGPRTTLANLEEADWRAVMDVNVTGNYLLARHFDPLLRKSDHGRVVFITSGSGSRARMAPGRGAYAISKAALDAVARTYAAETEDTPIRVMLCNPGPLRTDMRASIAPDEDPMSLRTPAQFAAALAPLCLAEWRDSGLLYDFPSRRTLQYREPA